MIHLRKIIDLPNWADRFAETAQSKLYLTDNDRIGLAIEAAALNVRNKTGGPFGAAVFTAGGALVSFGVNLVEPLNCSVLHAELVALMLAQDRIQAFSLGHSGEKHILATSSAPCVMCFGGIHWSGISRLIVASAKADVEAIGFDEGPIPADWAAKLEKSGVEVVQDCCREEGRKVLELYRKSGATIYNAVPRR